jgi:hydrogenase expression/formation protein HypE
MSSEETITLQGAVCPVPLSHQQAIIMGHGSGGKLSADLIQRLFLPPFDNPALRAGDDSGVVVMDPMDTRIAISTDSHVVWPLFFPGGDIGRLAVCGTVNDIAMMGANPMYLTAGFILEEGLNIKLLEQIVASMKSAADEAGIEVIAGDTKVVQKGKADGLYINTSGIGLIPAGVHISGAYARPGDVVILSGSIGDHGIAVLNARGDLGFETDLRSDVAPLNHLTAAMLEGDRSAVHVMRDPTRGGVATSLNEIARQSRLSILLDESKIPIKPTVSAACEMLGFDPLYIANEGKLIAIVSPEQSDVILSKMRDTQYGEQSVIIGEVLTAPEGRVLMKTLIGGTRIVDVLAGEMLPRIC